MVPSGRLSRFGDWSPLRSFCQLGNGADLRPFYAGTQAHSRMDLLRRAINDIRVNWSQYPQFMQELREFMARSDPDPPYATGAEAEERLEALFSSRKSWLDPASAPRNDDYSAIRLYVSEHGYRKMFRMINAALRLDGFSDDLNALRCATFLVELLNIDLFNYRGSNAHADNFEGRVYRGMCVSSRDLEMFARVSQGPLAERYLSIPLAMASASSDKTSALVFAQAEAARTPGSHPLMWDITVSGLDHELLALYQKAFPESVVTSLCAVPIDRLSDYPEEREVLLRGPHFQIVRLYKENVNAPPGCLHIVETVMLNSNRDHITAIASNTGEDRRARELFRVLINIHRSAVCADRADVHGFSADAAAYRSIVSANREVLASLGAD